MALYCSHVGTVRNWGGGGEGEKGRRRVYHSCSYSVQLSEPRRTRLLSSYRGSKVRKSFCTPFSYELCVCLSRRSEKVSMVQNREIAIHRRWKWALFGSHILLGLFYWTRYTFKVQRIFLVNTASTKRFVWKIALVVSHSKINLFYL